MRASLLVFLAVSGWTLLYVTWTILKSEERVGYDDATKLRLQQRHERLHAECNSKNVHNFKSMLRNIFVDKLHQLAWCPVFKAGSSIWMEIFGELSGALTPRNRRLVKKGIIDLETLIRRMKAPDNDLNKKINLINKSVKFIIVRHPFERLLAVYRELLENKTGNEYYYKKYSMHITRVYREKWIENYEPTFVEFLTFLSKEKIFDDLWEPISLKCAPCIMNYNYILKIESFASDTSLMLRQLQLNKYDRGADYIRKTDLITSKQYYSTVPRKLLDSIHNLYLEDFTLFNYSPSEYLKMTNQL